MNIEKINDEFLERVSGGLGGSDEAYEEIANFIANLGERVITWRDATIIYKYAHNHNVPIERVDLLFYRHYVPGGPELSAQSLREMINDMFRRHEKRQLAREIRKCS